MRQGEEYNNNREASDIWNLDLRLFACSFSFFIVIVGVCVYLSAGMGQPWFSLI